MIDPTLFKAGAVGRLAPCYVLGRLGLLFVSVSIRVDAIVRVSELRNRLAQTLALLLTGLLVFLLLTIPEQETWVLGVELLALFFAAI